MLKKAVIVTALAASIFAGALRPSYAFLDKTRFATDMGVAFFAFHHWVWNPYKHGDFSAGAPHRTVTIIKAGAALLVAVNRIQAADRLAHSSNSPTLHALVRPLDAMSGLYRSIGERMHSGHFNPADVGALNNSVSMVGSGAANAGIPIHDVGP